MPSSLSASRDSTSASLIARARVGDGQAWERLAELYGPVVYRWSRQAGLQDSDAADVMQEVFRDVARGLDGFEKQKEGDTFRGWLWTITRNQIRRLFNRQTRQPRPVGGTAANHKLEQTPDLLDQPSVPDDATVRTALVQRALVLIQRVPRAHLESLLAADHDQRLGCHNRRRPVDDGKSRPAIEIPRPVSTEGNPE
ncbi:MAG TPA: sigma-70 family RNA polymerase sigma factor [Pirellulaceae bacterium]|nr:sigma-70 family RNA polymerase sigma factor [Pirellulaceae bacterium]